jgi:membrane associated rhomboid family serine protease
LSLVLLGALVVVGAVTLGTDPVTEPEALAWGWGDGFSLSLLMWWIAHDGGYHLAANAVVLALFAPSLERYVGPVRLAGAVVVGNLLGLLAHGGLNVTDRPLLGASAMVYAIVAYSLVVGWHAPFSSRRGPTRRLWPARVFHGLLIVEALRWAVQVAGDRPVGGAAAHLGGIAAGVLVCGIAHRRWPGGPASRQARGGGACPPAIEVHPGAEAEVSADEDATTSGVWSAALQPGARRSA